MRATIQTAGGQNDPFLSGTAVPGRERCLQLIREMEMPVHIVFHSIQVGRVAVAVTDLLIHFGAELNRNLVLTGAVLHDITKNRSFTTGERHDATGRDFLVDKGFPEVGCIVGQHVRIYPESDRPSVTEAEIVNFSDKRVLHDKVVSLKERMAYILERYGKTPAHCHRIREMWREAEIIERKIQKRIPDQLSPVLEAHLQEPLIPDIETEMQHLFHPESEVLRSIKN